MSRVLRNEAPLVTRHQGAEVETQNAGVYERADWTLFRNLATLAQKAGVPVDDLGRLVCKELCDNALDVDPSGANVEIDGDAVIVSDEGPGMAGSDEEIARLFSIGRPLSSSKLRLLPTRGALGNGLRVAAGAVLATGGRLEVSTQGRTLRLEPRDDGTTAVLGSEPYDGAGTRVRVEFGDGIDEDLEWAQAAIAMGRGQEETYAGKSSAYFYDGDAFFELLQGAGDRSVRAEVAKLDGCAEPKAGEIAAPYLGRAASSLTRAETTRLLLAVRERSKEVNPERLGRVGAGFVYGAAYRRATGVVDLEGREVGARIPYQVEAWAVADDGDVASSAELFVNRSPVTSPLHHWVTRGANRELIVEGCGLNEQIQIGKKSVRLTINVDAPFVPLTSDGKAPNLAAFTEIAPAIEKAVEAARRGHTSDKGETLTSRIFEVLDEAIAQLRGSRVSTFRQRALYYVIRDGFLKDWGLRFKSFTAIITKYEAANDEIEGMMRDDRGEFVEPHTRRKTMLGTSAVEGYEYRPHAFRRIVVVEKQNQFEWMLESGFLERWDAALMCPKGQTTKAARKLADKIVATAKKHTEEIEVAIITDYDAWGSCIVDSFQNATLAAPERPYEVIHLGLHKHQAEAMGLEPAEQDEDESERRRKPVGSHVPPDEAEWLQTGRYELDMMIADRYLDWVEETFVEYFGEDERKVVPPVEVCETEQRRHLEQVARDQALADLKEQIDARAAEHMTALERGATERNDETPIDEQVREALIEDPSQDWRGALADVFPEAKPEGAKS